MRTIAEGINLKDSMSIEENLTKMRSAGKKRISRKVSSKDKVTEFESFEQKMSIKLRNRCSKLIKLIINNEPLPTWWW